MGTECRSRSTNKRCRRSPTTQNSTPHPLVRNMKGGYGFRGPRSGAYGGGKNGGYYNPKGGSWGMNGKGSWGGSSSWGNTGGSYGSDGGGKGAIKELCGMMAYKMEQEM